MENLGIEEKVNLVVSNIPEDKIYSSVIKGLVFKFSSSELDKINILPKIPKEKKLENLKTNLKFLASLLSEEKMDKRSDLYRCLSCVFGAFYGDELGSFCEFKRASWDNYKRILAKNKKPVCGCKIGQITDDSEMAMSLSFGIMENNSKNSIDSSYIYYFYGLWGKSEPYDIGNTVGNALSYFDFDQYNPSGSYFLNIERKIEESNKDSLSNGFLMRLSPFIVWFFYRNKDKVREYYGKNDSDSLLELYNLIYSDCRRDCKCTHYNEEAYSAATIFCILALGAICGLNALSILDVLEKLLKNKMFDDNSVRSKIKTMILEKLKDFRDTNFDPWNYFTNKNDVYKKMGWYFHAFSLVLYYLMYLDTLYSSIKGTTRYRFIMNEINNLGGDTDTNAAIVGTVIGPILGYLDFGEQFWDLLTFIEEKRWIYSPGLMIYFINYLQLSSDRDYHNGKEFLKMIITVLYFDISKE